MGGLPNLVGSIKDQKRQATLLALQIENYWMERGHDPGVKLKTIRMKATSKENRHHKIIAIETNLLNGLPRK